MADRRPFGIVLPPMDDTDLTASVFGDTERRQTLARSLAANLRRDLSAPAAVVVRPDAVPSLAVVGWATPEEQDGLETALDGFLGGVSRLRYVDYAQAEDDAVALAQTLRDALGPEQLERAVFTGIPRGGPIVLGMLAYALDLSPEQLTPQARPSAPLVVVDDCFLTGHRAAQFVNAQDPRSVVILAGLYAHPDLRTALSREHPAVTDCVTARDLTDHAPALYGDDYDAWKARMKAQASGPRYWIGVPDHLCFAWSEPDLGLRTEAAPHMQRGWQVGPADRCLARRGANDQPPDGDALVSVQPARTSLSEHAVRPAPTVFYAQVGEHTLVLESSSAACTVLDGTGAAFWWALINQGTVPEAQEALLSQYAVSPDVLETDLRTFVGTAVDQGLLVRDPPSGPT